MAILVLRRVLTSAALIITTAMFSACETARVAGPGRAEPPSTQPASVKSAEQAEAAGEYVVAAREYERLAETAATPERQTHLLDAAEALLQGGQPQQAKATINNVNAAGMDPAVSARKQIISARIAAAEGAPSDARKLLTDVGRTRNLSPAVLAQLHEARAQVEIAGNNPTAAVASLIAREQYIVGTEAIAANQKQLWDLLIARSRSELYAELRNNSDRTHIGWIELALAAVENGGNPTRLANAVNQWRQTHPQHPAGTTLLDKLTGGAAGLIGPIDRVALLLPLTSPYASAAQAVRDGFTAMEAATATASRPKTTIYDIGADPTQAVSAYERAVSEGAQMVVGPLGREATEAIIRNAKLSVPTLLLGHIEESPSGARQLFQFGLPPEQEARQAAERAYLDGHRQAGLLYPTNPWGERMAAAFTSHWQRLGGVLLATETYTDDKTDYSEPIKRLLNVTQSEQRKQLVEKASRLKVKHEPRPREDLEFIFLAADARRGRLIKPQLNYHRAKHLPVYATSHIFTGKSDPINDTDLDGIMFGDMPWILIQNGRMAQFRKQLQTKWPYAGSDLDRLFALGIDSYAILPHLNRISTENAARFAGVTSALSLDRDGRLRRQLTWAKFQKGTPRLLDPP